jgi:hypothetical protein
LFDDFGPADAFRLKDRKSKAECGFFDRGSG